MRPGHIVDAADATDARPWVPEVVSIGVLPPRAQTVHAGVVTAGVLEDLQRTAYDEAYARGLAEGYGAGQSRVAAQTERLSQILTDLARPLETLNEEVIEQIVALSTALARQLLRRELRQDRSQIISIVREAVGQLPVAARDVRIQLHPEDAAVVRESLAPAEHERAWTLVEDPMMMRGGCQVLTATSRVDARLDSRLGALLTEIMGSERDHGARTDGP